MPAKRALGEQKRQNDIFKTLIIAKKSIDSTHISPNIHLKIQCVSVLEEKNN